MSDSSFKPAGSGAGASLPFVSIDIPGDGARQADAGPNVPASGAKGAAPFVSVDIPDVAAAPNAGPRAAGSGSATPLPFVSVDISTDAG